MQNETVAVLADTIISMLKNENVDKETLLMRATKIKDYATESGDLK